MRATGSDDWPSSDRLTNPVEARAERMRVSGKHGLKTMSGDLGQVGVVHTGRPELTDKGMPALMRPDIEAHAFCVGRQTSR